MVQCAINWGSQYYSIKYWSFRESEYKMKIPTGCFRHFEAIWFFLFRTQQLHQTWETSVLPLAQLLLEVLPSSSKTNSSLDGKNYYVQTAAEIIICHFFPPPMPRPCPNPNTVSFLVFLSASVFLSQGQEESYSFSAGVSNGQCFPSPLGNSFHLPKGLS